ncbi:lysosomal acid lipase cholesteryl ester hydrolase precursor [Stemphylium lycopersici]|uniref:Lysosomal acid lipase cholesteryl ester hydrolase n=1 Tax=Stemphylium lycopersici TaxID=183478 RepID=A0A364NBJ3_STELY|nr:lysosomal acid lipase cholesteryl ester hydrolase precursor [Stemphylium lycopersici]RAR14612.1 lysosomal acid lipase cholesteryl ester hydrolase precursor [Stemphylium lycopersici]
MAEKGDKKASRQCWECLKRRLVCDHTLPHCKKCLKGGRQCSGYDDAKPLQWVQTGMVTSRRRKKKDNSAPKMYATVPAPRADKQDSCRIHKVSFEAGTHGPTYESDHGCEAVGYEKALTEFELDRDRLPDDGAGDVHVFSLQAHADAYEAAQQLTNLGRAKIEEVVEKGLDEEAAKMLKSKRDPLRRLKRMLWLLKSQDVPVYGYLANETCEVVQAVQYYNSRIHPQYKASGELAPNPAIVIFPPQALHLLTPAIHHTLVCISLSHFVHSLPIGADGTVTAINRSKIYHHRGEALRALGQYIGQDKTRCSDMTITSILMFMCLELQNPTFADWRSHISGMKQLIDLRGGPKQLMKESPHLVASVVLYLMYARFPVWSQAQQLTHVISIIALANTSSPSWDQIDMSSAKDSMIEDASSLYHLIFPYTLCPRELFTEILKVNELRAKASAAMLMCDVEPDHALEAHELMARIEAFSPEDWAQAGTFYSEWLTVGKIYKASVMLYCTLSLQSLTVLPCTASLHKTQTEYGDALLTNVRSALKAPRLARHMGILEGWAETFAGAAAASAVAATAMALHIPFLSRLHIREYIALFLSICLIGLESFIAVITLALPTPIINFCYRITRRLFNHLSSPSSKPSHDKKKGVWGSIASASDFSELCDLYGYYCEEHIVQTGDGYLLGLHRLGWKKGEENVRVNSGDRAKGVKKKVVYLHHGLMMNSEVWVCLTDKERCLPFELVERGYDVWLGNNRGNKYSKKSIHAPPTSASFWNFSMDQFAFHDIPDSISYILETTHQPSLSYIGFSQGTAQAFATLSIHPTLNDKVDVFIALAPAMSPKGVASGIVDAFVKASPDILYLAFGRKSILPSTTMWQSILYPPIFVRLIDKSLSFLFGWTAKNITPEQKLAAYPHLYSYTSTKSVVHWFQIIRNGTFQMYDDDAPNPITSNRSKYYKVAKFPTKNIKTPIVLVYGGSDSLVDINVMLKELPSHTIAKEIPHYEHLDFLWAESVNTLVFPHVFESLEKFAVSDNGAVDSHKERRWRQPVNYRGLLPESNGPNGTQGQVGYDDVGDERNNAPSTLRARRVSPQARRAISYHGPSMGDPSVVTSPVLASRMSYPAAYKINSEEKFPSIRSRIMSPPPTNRVSLSFDSPDQSQTTAQTSTSRPEGWWSSDEVAGTDPSATTTPASPTPARRSSFGSQQSTKSKTGKVGAKGITIGASKAVSGVSTGEGYGQAHNSEKDRQRLLDADKKHRRNVLKKKPPPASS